MRPDTPYKEVTDSELYKLIVKKYGDLFDPKDFEDGELEEEFCWRLAQAGQNRC